MANLQPLIAPIPEDEFLGSFWRRQPTHVKGAKFQPPIYVPPDYEDLRTETLRVVQTTEAGPRELDPDGVLNLNEAVRQGYTLVSRNYERTSYRLQTLLVGWKRQLKCRRVWSNLYITPSGARGFPLHQDTNEGFLFQIAGSKVWALHKTPEQPYAQTEVEAGDYLYIPMGWYHAATAGTSLSVHLTIAFEWSPV